MVDLGGKGKVPIISVDIPKAVSKDGDAKHLATNDLKMTGEDRTKCLEAALWGRKGLCKESCGYA